MIGALAWLGAFGVLAVAALDGPRPEGDWVGVVALVWLALIGLPRRRAEEPRRAVAMQLWAVLPVFAVAAVLDEQDGGALRTSLGAAVGFLVCGGLLSSIATVDRRTIPGKCVSGYWLLGIVALPALHAVMAWNDAPGGGAAWLELGAGISPLQLAYDVAVNGAEAWYGTVASILSIGLLFFVAAGARQGAA